MNIPNKVSKAYNLDPDGFEWLDCIGNYKDTSGEDWNKKHYLIYHYLNESNLSKKNRNKYRMNIITKAKFWVNIKINMGVKNFKEFYNQFTLEAFRCIGI